jgi:hypothetical protein
MDLSSSAPFAPFVVTRIETTAKDAKGTKEDNP